MKWTIAYADREFAREVGDPDLGEVEADTQDEAIEKAWQDKEIARQANQHTAGLWAYQTPDQRER